jgi:hypothetical protein
MVQLFPGQIGPAPAHRLFHHGRHRFGGRYRFALAGSAQRILVAVDQMFDDVSRGHAGKIRTAGRRCERQAETDEIMRRIADDSLVEIADLNENAAAGIRDRAEIAEMAIAAYPHRRTCGNVGRCLLQPFVEFHRRAAHVGVGGPGHLAALLAEENCRAVEG